MRQRKINEDASHANHTQFLVTAAPFSLVTPATHKLKPPPSAVTALGTVSLHYRIVRSSIRSAGPGHSVLLGEREDSLTAYIGHGVCPRS